MGNLYYCLKKEEEEENRPQMESPVLSPISANQDLISNLIVGSRTQTLTSQAGITWSALVMYFA